MTDFGYVILDTNLLMFMTIQACRRAVIVNHTILNFLDLSAEAVRGPTAARTSQQQLGNSPTVEL